MKLNILRRLFDELGKGEPLSPCCNAVVWQDRSTCIQCGGIVPMPFYFASNKPIPDELAILHEKKLRASLPVSTAIAARIAVPLLVLLCCLSGCETTRVSNISHRFRARVTFYHPHEDKWGRRTANGHQANEGRTVAAGWWAPFGGRVQIPQLKGVVGTGNFVVEDRGRDVENNKAAHGLMPVVDVFVATRAKYRYCKAHCSPVMEVLMP